MNAVSRNSKSTSYRLDSGFALLTKGEDKMIAIMRTADMKG